MNFSLPISAQPQLCGAGHNEHADKHEWKGIFDKKNQDDFTFYDQTVIHTQAVYVQKAHNYSVTFGNWNNVITTAPRVGLV